MPKFQITLENADGVDDFSSETEYDDMDDALMDSGVPSQLLGVDEGSVTIRITAVY